jgi:glycosyltransferase involved in cell wall biosynthesis
VRHLGSAAGKDVDVATWRADYGALLSSARKVFVPDADVSQRLARYFPAQEFTLRPHPETGGAGGGQQADLFSRRQALGSLREAGGAAQEQSKDSSEQGEAARAVGVTGGGISPLKIVIVGGIAPHKGSKVLFDCAQEALQRNLPLHFTLIGYSDIDAKLKTLKNVTVTGHFTPSELTQKLQAGGFHCAFLPSVIPETYNYVLSQCWQHGLFAVCFDIGAIASRIKAASHLGAILPYEWYYQPEKINDALLALSIPTLPTDLPLTDYTSITRDYYGL